MTQTQSDWQAESPEGWLLVTIDRLPAWMVAAWGATWVATPAITRLATAGLICDRVLVRSTEPLDTLTELATGRLPLKSVKGGVGRGPLAAAVARGWRVTVVTDVPDQVHGMSGGDAGYRLVAVPPSSSATTTLSEKESGCGRVIAAAEVELAGADLLWCHLGSLGLSWDAPQACREAFFDEDDPSPGDLAAIPDFDVTAKTDPDRVATVRQIFAGELAHLDDWLGRLVAAAATRWNRFGLLLMGVRGMPLGLHGRVGVDNPEPPPYAELTHVPAILLDPAGRQTAQRFGQLVLPADLGATVHDLIVGEGSETTRPKPDSVVSGQSLAALLSGDTVPWRSFGRDRVLSGSQDGQAVAVADWSLIRDASGNKFLFRKPDDFFELSNVADRSQEAALALADCLPNAGPHVASDWERPLPEWLMEADSSSR